MRRMALGFLAGFFMIAPLQQEPLTPETITITAQDCIDTITDFNVHHHQPTIFIPFGTFGTTDFYGRTIHLFDNFSMDMRRRTSVHELIHIKLAALGEVQWPEEAINKAELRLYRQIFASSLR